MIVDSRMPTSQNFENAQQYTMKSESWTINNNVNNSSSENPAGLGFLNSSSQVTN